MLTLKTSIDPTIISVDAIPMGECFIPINENHKEADVYMRIHSDVGNSSKVHIYVDEMAPGHGIPLTRSQILCAKLEDGRIYLFDKDERVIPVTGIFRWEEKHGIKS